MSSHYLTDKPEYEVIEILRNTLTKDEFAGYLKGNVLKYIFRAGKKIGEPLSKDLDKAVDYITWWKGHNLDG